MQTSMARELDASLTDSATACTVLRKYQGRNKRYSSGHADSHCCHSCSQLPDLNLPRLRRESRNDENRNVGLRHCCRVPGCAAG